jgi:hypothetical protein
MSNVPTSFLIMGGIVVAFFLVASAIALGKAVVVCLRKTPPRPSFSCPSCRSEQIDVLSQGFWDGHDEQGRGVHGGFEYGLCQRCGSRCARVVDDQPFVPSDEQWRSHFEPMEKMHRKRESWPFESSDEKTVA